VSTLITITQRDGQPTVSARELHAFLEVQTAFKDWIARRLAEYGFDEGKDFCSFLSESQGGRPAREIALSLDTAKELAMVERNDRGRQARQYFIECERRARTIELPDLSDPASLRTLLLGYTEKVLELQATVVAQAPKVAFAEAVGQSGDLQSIGDAAKLLGTGQKRLFAFLRENGVLMVNNLPFQHHLDAGRFKVVEKPWTGFDGATRLHLQTMVTGKGITFLQQRLARAAEAKA
jgi:anti-repressor protein